MKKVLIIILIWALAFYAAKVFITIYQADEYLHQSQVYLTEGDTDMALFSINLAIKNNPLEPNYYRVRAKILMVGIAKDEAFADLQSAYKLNPNNLVTIRNEIPLYYFLAGYPSLDEKYLSLAKNFFEESKMIYKNDAGVVSLIAKYEKKLNLVDEYQESVKMVGVLRPDLLDWYDSFR